MLIDWTDFFWSTEPINNRDLFGQLRTLFAHISSKDIVGSIIFFAQNSLWIFYGKPLVVGGSEVRNKF